MQAELYQALGRVAIKKQDEIKDIIITTRDNESEKIIENAASLKLQGHILFFLYSAFGFS